MGTTPNYAIPYPEITDFVADGATAMENIAEKVDQVLRSATNGRNRLINGDFRVAQRGTSFVAGANNDDTYNLDRWYVLSEANDTVDITQANVAPTGGLFSIGLDVETINNKFGIAQIIEQRNIVGCAGTQCTLSFKFRTSGSSINNVKAAIIAWTGTGDTVTSDFVSAWNADGVDPTLIANAVYENTPINLNPTNDWQTASITALIDATPVNNLAVFIWCDDKTTTLADFLYVTDVQFEVGIVATAFERRHIQVELADCQRYYQRVTSTGGGNSDNTFCTGLVFSTTTTIASYNFSTMRASPTFNFAGGTYDVVVANAAISVSGISAINVTLTSAQVSGTISVGSAGGGSLIRLDSGFFDLSIEL
jgi:hypothetical protein